MVIKVMRFCKVLEQVSRDVLLRRGVVDLLCRGCPADCPCSVLARTGLPVTATFRRGRGGERRSKGRGETENAGRKEV
jgi:hypothetical protein